MRTNTKLILILLLLIVVAAFYRFIPGRPMNFAPHLAMALFAGSIIQDRKWAFAFPIFSMFLSDLIYHFFYLRGMSAIPGFYEGQLTNYLLFAGMTWVGSFMRKFTVKNIAVFSLLINVIFFLLSNFFVWQAGQGYARPKTFAGLMACYGDGLPFLVNSVLATLAFGAVLFGGWWLMAGRQYRKMRVS